MLILASFSYFHRLGVGCGVNMINDHTGWFLSLSGAQLSRVQLLMKHFNEPRLLGRIKVFILSPALSNVKLITMAMKGANKMHHSNWRVEGRAAPLQRTKYKKNYQKIGKNIKGIIIVKNVECIRLNKLLLLKWSNQICD